MAPRLGRKKRKAPPLDEFGGTADGGLAIIDESGHLVHMTPPRIAGSLRYFLARVQLHDAQGMPERLALTSALVGEGVTYITRSLAAAIAYDTDASVVVVDCTFRRPGAQEGKGRPRALGQVDDARRSTADPTDGDAEGEAAPAAPQRRYRRTRRNTRRSPTPSRTTPRSTTSSSTRRTPG